MSQALMRRGALLLLAVVMAALVTIPAFGLLWRHEGNRFAVRERAAVHANLDEILLSLRSALAARLSFLKAIAALAVSRPEVTGPEFAAFAGTLTTGIGDIRSLQLARNLVVSHVFPAADNPGVTGLHLPGDLPLRQREAFRRALRSGGPILDGPEELLQGGRGLIVRLPVKLPGAASPLWGMATLIIDADAFLKDARLGRDAGVALAIRSENDRDTVPVMVYGDPHLFAATPVVAALSVPGGRWLLAAVPTGGWGRWPFSDTLYIGAGGVWLTLSMVFFLLLSRPAWLATAVARATAVHHVVRAELEGKVAERTAKLLAANRTLRRAEDRSRAFIDATSDMTFLKDPDLRHVACNKNLADFFGVPIAQVIGRTDFELMPADLAARCQASDVAAREGRELVSELETVEGRTFEVRKFPVPLDEGGTGVGGYIRDISDRLAAERALRQSESALRTLYENAPIGIFTSTPQGRYLKANAALAHMYGFETPQALIEEVVDAKVQMYCDPADRDRLLRQLQERDPLSDYEICRRTRTGSRLWVSLNIRAVRDATGAIQHLEGFCTDITKRKQAEESLAAQERQLRIIVENSPLGLVYFDEKGVVINCNRRHLALMDITAEQILGVNVFDRLPPIIREALGRALAGEPAMAEGPYTSVFSGRSLSVRAIFNPVEAGHAPTPVIASVEDITAERQKDASLRLLQAAVEQSPASIVITDADGTIEYVNPHFFTLTGYASSEAIGHNPRILKSGAHPDVFYHEMWETLLRGQVWRGELCNRKKDGTLYWEDASISPVRDENGRITHFVGVKEDITARKELESIREDVERIMRHDLKAPLNSIINLPGLIASLGAVTTEQQELLDDLERAGQGMLDQIELSLDLYKMETGTYVLNAQRIDLARIVSATVDMLTNMANTRGIALVVRADTPIFVQGSALLCQSIAANLLKNAMEAETTGRTVTVHVCSQAGRGVLTIHNPTPVPPNIIPVFFEKYVTSGKDGGSGLGTYSARLMTQCQRGEIRMDSSPEAGTTLTVSLPEN